MTTVKDGSNHLLVPKSFINQGVDPTEPASTGWEGRRFVLLAKESFKEWWQRITYSVNERLEGLSSGMETLLEQIESNKGLEGSILQMTLVKREERELFKAHISQINDELKWANDRSLLAIALLKVINLVRTLFCFEEWQLPFYRTFSDEEIHKLALLPIDEKRSHLLIPNTLLQDRPTEEAVRWDSTNRFEMISPKPFRDFVKNLFCIENRRLGRLSVGLQQLQSEVKGEEGLLQSILRMSLINERSRVNFRANLVNMNKELQTANSSGTLIRGAVKILNAIFSLFGTPKFALPYYPALSVDEINWISGISPVPPEESPEEPPSQAPRLYRERVPSLGSLGESRPPTAPRTGASSYFAPTHKYIDMVGKLDDYNLLAGMEDAGKVILSQSGENVKIGVPDGYRVHDANSVEVENGEAIQFGVPYTIEEGQQILQFTLHEPRAHAEFHLGKKGPCHLDGQSPMRLHHGVSLVMKEYGPALEIQHADVTLHSKKGASRLLGNVETPLLSGVDYTISVNGRVIPLKVTYFKEEAFRLDFIGLDPDLDCERSSALQELTTNSLEKALPKEKFNLFNHLGLEGDVMMSYESGSWSIVRGDGYSLQTTGGNEEIFGPLALGTNYELRFQGIQVNFSLGKTSYINGKSGVSDSHQANVNASLLRGEDVLLFDGVELRVTDNEYFLEADDEETVSVQSGIRTTTLGLDSVKLESGVYIVKRGEEWIRIVIGEPRIKYEWFATSPSTGGTGSDGWDFGGQM